MDTFGEVIRKERKAKSWTLERAGKRVGLSKGGLSQVEHGEVNPPSAGVVRKIAKLYGLDVTDMMRMAWQPKVPKEIRHLLEVKDGSKDQPVADTPVSTEAATAVFKEAFKAPDGTALPPTVNPRNDGTGLQPSVDYLQVRPVEGLRP